MANSLCGQISVKPSEGKRPDDVVKQFVTGDGVTITNVKFNGQSKKLKKKGSVQLGIFSNNQKGFPDFFTSGIILCTGDCKSAEGPNDNGGITIPIKYSKPYRCAELEKIITPYPANFPAVLEFDFSSVTSHVRFRYCFASEEYPTFSCSAFNDVFGFFVKDTKTGKTENIALIPGTNKAVSVNNIHPDYGEDCKAVHAEYLTMIPFGSKKMQFNGYVGPFVAEADLIPGRIYHITLAIAHASDMALESAVFLEASSFGAVDDNGIVVMGDGKPALYSKTETLSGGKAKGISFDDMENGKGSTGISAKELGKSDSNRFNPDDYNIHVESTYGYLFDSITAHIDNDSIVVSFNSYGQWCDCLMPDEIPVRVVMTPKKLGENGTQLTRYVVLIDVPVAERSSWLSRCFWALFSLILLLFIIIWLNSLLRKKRFKKNARIRSAYYDRNEELIEQNATWLRKKGFIAWFCRWFLPMDERRSISTNRPRASITFYATESKGVVRFPVAHFNRDKMSVDGYDPDINVRDKFIKLHDGGIIEISNSNGSKDGRLIFSAGKENDEGGYRLFVGLLMILSVVLFVVLAFLMIRGFM